jgi:hypothetical protein
MNVFIAGLSDGRAVVTVWGREKVWIYDPPGSGEFFQASQPIELDLSNLGITEIGGIAGNIFFESGCEGNFDCDDDTDGTDAATFKVDFGRGPSNAPCTSSAPCNGDFDCDTDVDGTDASKFKSDFGRSNLSNPCPACTGEDVCGYES